MRPATPAKSPTTEKGHAQPRAGGDPQSWSARRKRSASARSLAAISSARAACSLAFAASGPPSSASLLCRRGFLLDRGNLLRCCGDPLTQRLAPRLRLLGSLQRIGAVAVRVSHGATGTLPPPELTGSRWSALGPRRSDAYRCSDLGRPGSRRRVRALLRHPHPAQRPRARPGTVVLAAGPGD
jgi:hypothetical protein